MPVNKGRKRKRTTATTVMMGSKKRKLTVARIEKQNQVLYSGSSGLNPYRSIGTSTKVYPEVKYQPNEATAVMKAGGDVIDLAQIAQGLGASQRIGNQIKVKNAIMRINIQQDANTPNFADYVRLMIFIDRDADQNPVTTDVLESSDTLSHYNWPNRGRFDYLYDQTFTLNAASNQCMTMIQSVPINRVVTYSGNFSTSTQKNKVCFLFLCAAGSNQPVINYNIRLKYRDP